MEIDKNITQHTITTNLSASLYIPHTDTNVVKVKIKYPEDWKGQKFFADGDVKEVAKETADDFIAKGIATIVTEEAKVEIPAEKTLTENTGDDKKTGDVKEVAKETADDKVVKKADEKKK